MKHVLFNQLSAVFFLSILVTHFLIQIGRNKFVIRNKKRDLIPAILAAVFSVCLLAYYGAVTYWWMMICLSNIGIMLIIFTDELISGFIRLLMRFRKSCEL